jgi:uncharacterized linocin/CFP29 family protein
VDVLNRVESPLNEQEWDDVRRRVIAVARRNLVGRRFLPLYGPLGAGMQMVAVDRSGGWDLAAVAMQGQSQDQVAVERRYQSIPVLSKDFVVDWRDLDNARSRGEPLDFSMAEAAASYVALAEDHLLLHGLADYHLDGLLTVDGRHVLPSTGWEKPGSGFDDVVRAARHLTAAGFLRPYAVLAGVTTYAAWHRLYRDSGVLEVEQIERLVGGGVHQSPLVPDDTMLVLAFGPENMDLAVGLDTSVAFVESTHMNHVFRVIETLSLRIKRTGAICQITQES